MKYTISESRLDKAVDAYLDTKFTPNEIVEFDYAPRRRRFFVVNGAVLGEWDLDSFWVDEDIVRLLRIIFSFDDEDDALKKIRGYLQRNQFIDDNTDVYILEMSIINQQIYDEYLKK